MTLYRPLAIGGGAILFVLLLFWMLPPTTPKGGTASPVIPHIARTQSPLTTTSAAPDAAFTLPPAPPPLPVDQRLDPGARSAPPLQAPRQAYGPEESARSAPDPDPYLLADSDPQEVFDRGYRWAQRRQVEDPRECRRWADTPAEDGCRAFLQDVREQRDYASDDDEEDTDQ